MTSVQAANMTPSSPYARHLADEGGVHDDMDVLHLFLDNASPASDLEPLFGLGCVGVLLRFLDEREADLVRQARGEGATWSHIARTLGRSRQEVWDRYADRDERNRGLEEEE